MRLVLRLRGHRAVLQAADGFHQQSSTDLRQSDRQGSGGFVRLNRDPFLKKNRAGIHPFVHHHGGDACLAFAVDDRPLDRSRAAVFRKQGGMDVDTAARRHPEHGGRQDAPEGGHRDEVRLPCPERLKEGWVLQLDRLQQGQPFPLTRELHRCRRHRLSPPFRPVRLGDHADHGIFRPQQRFQRGDRERRRSHEHDAHAVALTCPSWKFNLTNFDDARRPTPLNPARALR